MGPPSSQSVQQHAKMLGPRGLILREQYVRVLEQALRALGYDAVAEQLEAASGVVQQLPQGAAFRAAVLQGRYDEALRLLPSVAASPASVSRSRCLLLRRKYLECVARGEMAEALQVLRQELQPLLSQQSVLHNLAALLLQPSAPGLGPASPASNGSASPGGAAGGVSLATLEEGRAALLDELQDSLVPSLLLPERRLEELVEQALVSQLDRAPFHNCADARLSLLSNYTAGPEQLPTAPGQVLEAHSSEVWSFAFSPDGCWAASTSKDGSALLWSVSSAGLLDAVRTLHRSHVPCQLASFSPDSRLVLVASTDASVRLYDVPAGKLLQQYSVDSEGAGPGEGSYSVVPLSWFPSGDRFLSGTARGLAVFSASPLAGASVAPARQLHHLPHAFIYDALVAHNGEVVVTVGHDRRIAFTRLSDGRTATIASLSAVTSVSLSRCGRLLTANLSESIVHCYQLPQGLAGALATPPHHEHGEAVNSSEAALANGAAGGHAGGAGECVSWEPLQPVDSCAAGPEGGDRDPLDALPLAPAHEFSMGDGPGRYVLRACVGGARNTFVACGAEDSHLYIWSLLTGNRLACLAGHAGCINAVAWHPTLPWLVATASDDGTIRTWVAPAAQQRQHAAAQQ